MKKFILLAIALVITTASFSVNAKNIAEYDSPQLQQNFLNPNNSVPVFVAWWGVCKQTHPNHTFKNLDKVLTIMEDSVIPHMTPQRHAEFKNETLTYIGIAYDPKFGIPRELVDCTIANEKAEYYLLRDNNILNFRIK